MGNSLSDNPYASLKAGSWNVGLIGWLHSESLRALFGTSELDSKSINFKFENRDFQGMSEVTIKLSLRKEMMVEGIQSKFCLPYVTAMTMLGITTSAKWIDNGKEWASIAIALSAGIRLGVKSKYVLSRKLDGSGRKKDKQNTGHVPTKLRYGLVRSRRRSAWLSLLPRLWINYSKKKKGPELHPIHLWIVILKNNCEG